MSGEYYRIEEKESTKFPDYDTMQKIENEDDENMNLCPKKSQDFRLHDIEEQLEMAENRCNILKSQLDYMKQIYGVNKSVKNKRSNSKGRAVKKPSSDTGSFDSKSFPRLLALDSGMKTPNPPRQNSNQISTDTTGAAVRTINNILNGITASVNRLSEMYVDNANKPQRKGKRTKTADTFVKIDENRQDGHVKTMMQEISTNNSSLLTIKSKLNNRKNTRPASKRRIEMSKKSIETKNKSLTINKSTNSELINKKSKKSMWTCRTNVPNAPPTQNSRRLFTSSTCSRRCPSMLSRHKLVEIYHNEAARASDSENDLDKIKAKKVPIEKTACPVPPLKINTQKVVIPPQEEECFVGSNQQLDQEFGYNEPEAPRTCHSFIRSYELPTIASRMKQVTKNYLNSFNFKAIPFCVALATTPSHNIGINIQQVMNIIKNKQPVKGISPTLFHNIGLAAERLNSRPLSAFISSVKSSRMTCPMNRISSNLQTLQEAAKTIPDDIIEECDEEEAGKSCGPSGDTENINPIRQPPPVWSVDSSRKANCTCLPKDGVDFKQVINKYNRSTATFGTTSQGNGRSSSWRSKYRLPAARASVFKNNKKSSKPCVTPPNAEPDINGTSRLQGKEKTLKDVLTNLHNEFESLNKKYEELSEKAATDKEAAEELERLEKDLDIKEEEITMVMSLYKEVVALKQQVHALKENNSGQNVNTNKDQQSAKCNEYNNPTAALHLIKLLRHIQQYQSHYKK